MPPLRLAAPLIFVWSVGCASVSLPPGPPLALADTTRLWPAGRLTPDQMLQQHLLARWGQGEAAGEQGFDAVVQKVGDELTVLGLSPIGQVGFVIQLVDTELTYENHSDRELPFPPRLVLLDVQRVFYPWFDRAPNEAEWAAGQRVGLFDGETLLERLDEGRCVERRFTRVADSTASPTPGAIVVRYQWDPQLTLAPRRATLTNERQGYELTIDTHVETVLEEAP